MVPRRSSLSLAALVGAFVVLTAQLALADQIVNTIDSSVDATPEEVVITAGGSAVVSFYVKTENDIPANDVNGCNATGSDPATVNFAIPANVTASVSSLTFAGCGPENAKSITFGSTVPNATGYLISVASVIGGRSGSLWETGPAAFKLIVNAAAPSDTTPPVVTITFPSPNGQNNWFTSGAVNGSVSAADPSNVTAINCTDTADGLTLGALVGGGTGTASRTLSVTGEGTHNISCTATDGASTPNTGAAAGSTSMPVEIKIDSVKPTVTCPSPAPSFLLNQTPADVTASVEDTTSGPVSTSVSGAANTSSVGAKTISLTGEDNAGNMKSANCGYSVGYQFVGFSSPVNNGGVLNTAKAGQAIPLKWRLLDANDVPVATLASSSVKVTVANLSCTLGTSEDLVEEYAAGSSGLQNLGDGYYQFNWKTPTNYANSCKTMHLDLGEGSSRTALFQFRK